MRALPIRRSRRRACSTSAIDKFVPVKFFDYVNQKMSDTKPSVTVQIPEGTAAPAAGLTFVQIAREGLGYQKTQNGGGTLPQPSPFNSSYHRYGSRVPAAEHETSFFDGIDVSVAGIAALAHGDTQFLKDGLAAISQSSSDALKRYDVDRPAGIAPQLADGSESHASADRIGSARVPSPIRARATCCSNCA